jgi:phosphatidylinositol alpha-1,6-mannosyltransferase
VNILVLSGNFPPTAGGIAVFSEHVCTELWRAGHRIHVLAPSAPCATAVDARFPFPVKRYPVVPRLSSLPAILETARNGLRKRFDIVFITHFMCTHALGVLFLSKILKVPYVILIHGFDLTVGLSTSWLDNLVACAVLKNSALIIANSEFTKSKVIQAGYQGRIVVVHPGVDADLFHPGVDASQTIGKYGLQNKKVALTVSRLVPRKGHENVLRAVPAVIQRVPNFVYLIVGSGDREAFLREMVSQLDIQSHVIFAGYIEDEQLPSFYAASDVFVMPAYEKIEHGNYEGFGIVFSEAAACGKPVVGGNSGGIPEAIVEGVTGLLVDPYNIDEIAQALICLLTDQEYARKLGMNGRQRVERELAWQRVGAKIEAALREVLCSATQASIVR